MKPGYINLRVMRVDQVTQPHTKCYDRLSDQQCVSQHETLRDIRLPYNLICKCVCVCVCRLVRSE